MEYSYLGIFSSVFNWVLDKILSPVFTFVGNLLSTVLSWIFNNILGPLLKEVLWPLIEAAAGLIMNLLAGLIFGVYIKLLSFIDYMNQGFDYMIGLDTVIYNDSQTTLLELFVLRLPGVSRVFWAINFIGLALALIFTIYSISKSAMDFDFENRRPVSKVLSLFFKCFIQLLTVQFFVYFLVKLSGVVLGGISFALSKMQDGGRGATIGSIIFCVSSMNAAINTTYNLKTADRNSKVGIMDTIRNPYYIGTTSYTDLETVKKSFNLADFDYLIGFALALFLIVVMAACLLVFVQRLFDVLVLYLASPYFVAMMPLDDGQRFGKWRELFIGKVFSGFGTVMAMKLYLLLCPTIMSPSVRFDASSVEMDYVARMVFLAGGAWATLKAGPVITNLLSAEAGGQESGTAGAAVLGAMAVGRTAMNKMGDWAEKGGKALGNKFRAARQDSRQQFENTKFTPEKGGQEGGGASIPGADSSLTPPGQEVASGSGGAGAVAPELAGSETGASTGGVPEAGGGSRGGAVAPEAGGSGAGTVAFDPAGSETRAGTVGGVPEAGGTDTGTGTVAPEAAGSDTRAAGGAPETGGSEAGSAMPAGEQAASSGQQGFFKKQDKGELAASYPLGFKKYRMKDGSTRIGCKLGGSLLGIQRDGKGIKFSFLGASIRVGNDGKVKSWGLPCGAAKWKLGNDGKMHTAKVNLLSMKWSANTATGKMQFTDCGFIGLHREFDKGGKGHLAGLFGIKREKQENGEYRLTSLPGGVFQQSYMKDKDGKLQTAGIRFMGVNLKIDARAAKHNEELKKAREIKQLKKDLEKYG